MYYQHRRARKQYRGLSAADTAIDACQFCNPRKYASQIFQETEHAYVILNRTFYDQWELRKVIDHRMIIPKSHVTTLGELNPAERADIMDIIADYESRNYEIYARSPESSSRSVPHQHTHLIKAEHHAGRGLFYWSKPYILWLFK